MLLCLSLFIFHLTIAVFFFRHVARCTRQLTRFGCSVAPKAHGYIGLHLWDLYYCTHWQLTRVWLCITFENNNNHFFFVCHMLFCHLVGLLCVCSGCMLDAFLKHTQHNCHGELRCCYCCRAFCRRCCCCRCCVLFFYSYRSINVHRFPSKCFSSKCRILAEKCWKRRNKQPLHETSTHTHTNADRTTPEHINSVLQSAIDSNQSCDLNNIVIMNAKVNQSARVTVFPNKSDFFPFGWKVFDYFSK